MSSVRARSGAPLFLGHEPSTAPDETRPSAVVRVTHPFHPLFDQVFELLERRRTWGEDRVYLYDADGRLRRLPASWTDAADLDPFVIRAAGRSPFRAEDLARLAAQVAALGARESVKGITPDM